MDSVVLIESLLDDVFLQKLSEWNVLAVGISHSYETIDCIQLDIAKGLSLIHI